MTSRANHAARGTKASLPPIAEPSGPPDHLLPYCDLCARKCEADDWSDAAGMFICPICLEDMIYAHHCDRLDA